MGKPCKVSHNRWRGLVSWRLTELQEGVFLISAVVNLGALLSVSSLNVQEGSVCLGRVQDAFAVSGP